MRYISSIWSIYCVRTFWLGIPLWILLISRLRCISLVCIIRCWSDNCFRLLLWNIISCWAGYILCCLISGYLNDKIDLNVTKFTSGYFSEYKLLLLSLVERLHRMVELRLDKCAVSMGFVDNMFLLYRMYDRIHNHTWHSVFQLLKHEILFTLKLCTTNAESIILLCQHLWTIKSLSMRAISFTPYQLIHWSI